MGSLRLYSGEDRVDSGRGQDRTLRGKAPVRHVPPLRYPFIPAGVALSVRGSSSGRRSRSPRPPPNRGQERLTGASHMNGTETIAEAGPYPYTSPHDGNAHRIRALFHRPAGSGRPALGALGAGRRRGSHLHPITASPAPPAPAPASTRPSPPCAKATRWSCRNSTGWQGPSQMRAPSPIGCGNEA